MSRPTNKVGIVIAKINSGGALRLTGDRVILVARNSQSEQEWILREKIAACSTQITDAVHKHGGIVARRSLETVFATFPNASDAFEAACQVQRDHHKKIRLAAEQTNSAPLGLRIGLAFGKMLVDAGQISGDAVATATQIASQANSGKIIAAESLINSLGDGIRGSVKSLGMASIEAAEQDTEIFEVQWDASAASNSPETSAAYAATLAAIVPPAESALKLRVSYRGKEIILDAKHHAVTLRSGKEHEPHARLEYRETSFYLVNLRANGTRLRNDGGEEELCQDETQLAARGAVCLGAEFVEGSADLLTFTLL